MASKLKPIFSYKKARQPLPLSTTHKKRQLKAPTVED